MANAKKLGSFEHIENFGNNGKTFRTMVVSSVYKNKVSKFSQTFFAITYLQREKPGAVQIG